MDALRGNVTKTTVSLKAAQFRLHAATTTLTTSQQALTSALTALKAENSAAADVKQRATAAAAALKDAQAKVSDAEAEVEAREIEADKALASYNNKFALRARRDPRFVNHPTAGDWKAPADHCDPAQPLEASAVAAYHAEAKATFADYAAIKAFPAPPTALCTNVSCMQTKGSRALEACGCNIRCLFEGMTEKELKQAKLTLHPDRFNKVPDEAVRADCKAKAKEICAVLNSITQTPRKEQKKGQKGQKGPQNNNPAPQIRKKGGKGGRR